MILIEPGTLVVVDFPDVIGPKRRPAVVVSSALCFAQIVHIGRPSDRDWQGVQSCLTRALAVL